MISEKERQTAENNTVLVNKNLHNHQAKLIQLAWVFAETAYREQGGAQHHKGNAAVFL